MSVLWITVLLSALLAFIFIALYVRDQARDASQHRSGPEQAALLPLQEPVETRQGVPGRTAAVALRVRAGAPIDGFNRSA